MPITIDYRYVLLAIGNQGVEEKIAGRLKAVNETHKQHPDNGRVVEYSIEQSVTAQDALTEYLANHRTPQILVYSEALGMTQPESGVDSLNAGGESAFDYILNLHRQYPGIRIVFLAGDRRVGDTKLAALVAYHIYDFLTGKIKIPDIVGCIDTPKSYDDVREYLPKMGSTIFEGGNRDMSLYQASAEAVKQNAAEMKAEREAYETQITELTGELEKTRQDAAGYSATVSKLEAQLRSAQSQAASNLALEQAKASERQRSVEAARSELEGRYTTAVTERDNLQVKLTDAMAENGRLSEENRSLKDEKSAMNTKAEQLQAQLDSALTNVERLENDCTTTRSELRDKSEQYDTLNAETSRTIQSLRTGLESANARIDELIATKEAAEQDVRRLTTELATCQEQLTGKATEIETQGIRHGADVQTLNAALNSANARCEELDNSLRKAREDVRIASEQREEYRKALAAANAQLDGSEHQAVLVARDLEKQQLATEIASLRASKDEAIRVRTADIEAQVRQKQLELEAIQRDVDAANARKNDVEASVQSSAAAAQDTAAAYEAERVKKQAEVDALNSEIASLMSKRDNIADAVSAEMDVERAKYRDDMAEQSKAIEAARAEREKAQSELDAKSAELEVMRNAASNAQAERERLETDLRAVRETSSQAIEEERSRVSLEVARVRKDGDAQLAKIAAAFNAEKSRLSADYQRHQDEIRALEQANGVICGYRYKLEDFVSDDRRGRNPVITMFYSRTPGCGTTSVAVNTAAYLATAGKKTLFLSFEWINPVFKERFGFDFIRPCLYNAVENMVMGDYSGLERAVITKQGLFNSDDRMRQFYARYPDMLHFAAYADASTDALPPSPDLIKGILAYYAKKKNYERIIVDLPSYIDPALVETVRVLCSRHVIVMEQDPVSMNHTGDFFSMSRSARMDAKNVRVAMSREPIVVCNRYVTNTPLTTQRIAQFCGVQSVCTVCSKPHEFLAAYNQFSPVVVVSRDEEYVRCIQSVCNYINGVNR